MIRLPCGQPIANEPVDDEIGEPIEDETMESS